MLQHWFRDSGDFVYSVDVSTGHGSLDLDDWLNDPNSLNYRTGYCEQFAASMAVMGRALGIPSRVVIGFTPGTPDVNPDGVRYVEVLDTNAHAWVEMFFDGFGWVSFDPTPRTGSTQPASMTAGFLPETYAESQSPNALQPPNQGLQGFLEPEVVEPTAIPQAAPRWWIVGVFAIVLLVLLIPAAKRIRRRRRLNAIQRGDITAAWEELVDRLDDLGTPVPASSTPLEFAQDTDSALVPLAVRYSSTIYGGREGQGEITDLYGMEGWVETNYDGLHRARAALNPRSLWRR